MSPRVPESSNHNPVLGLPKTDFYIYYIKKQFYGEMAVNVNVAKGLGEPSPVRKNHKRRRDSLDKVNDNFTGELQRAMRGLAANMGVAECTIRRYVKLHIHYKLYKMRRGQFMTERTMATRYEKSKKMLKVIVTVFSSGCLQIGFGVLIIDDICNFLI